jgi:mRNA interferase RelE/StbE
MYDLDWHKEASRELDKLDNFIAAIIVKKVDQLKGNPFSKDVTRLIGRDEYRLRVGDYRVIFEIMGSLIWIKKVGHRKHIYDF